MRCSACESKHLKKSFGIVLLLTVLISLCPVALAQDSTHYLTGPTFVCGTSMDAELFINMSLNNDQVAQTKMLTAKRCLAVDLGANKLPVYALEFYSRSQLAKIRLKNTDAVVWTHKKLVYATRP